MRGFTLLEVLVALVLLALFTVVAYRALNAVLDAQRRAEEEMERWQALAAVFARVESDLSNATVLRGPSGLIDQAFSTRTGGDGSSQFDLVRRLPEDAEDGVRRVGYRCADGNLVQLAWPLGADGEDGVEVAREKVMVRELRSCAFRFMNDLGQWLDHWRGSVLLPLPRAVELQMVDHDGTALRRVWRVQ